MFLVGIGTRGVFQGLKVTRRAMTNTSNISFLRQDEAQEMDEKLFSKYGYSVDQLMELAGLSAAQAVHSHFPQSRVLVLCGPGNNGGDGFVCARHLLHFGFSPFVVYPKESKSELMKRLVVQIETLDIPLSTSLPENLNDFGLVVDAFFGFSFKPPVREPFDEMIARVSESKKPVFSIDIPSGWNVETGPPSQGVYITPSAIISLTAPKKCLEGWEGVHFLGGRFVPASLAKEHNLHLPVYPDSSQFLRIS